MTQHRWKNRLCTVALATGAVVGALGAPAHGQTAPFIWDEMPLQIDSGIVRNDGTATTGDFESVVFSTVVSVPGADWTRLTFGDVELNGSRRELVRSYLRITSLEDGADQILHMDAVHAWQHRTAYFNGNQLLVELIATPGSGDARVEITGAWAGQPHFEGGIGTQCGAFDNRTLSSDGRTGRLLPVGCTGFLIADGGDSCFLAAGHCTDPNEDGTNDFAFDTMEFNVPLSNPNGSINFADPDDQYPVDNASIQFETDGLGAIGEDWLYAGTDVNSNTGLFARVAQGVTGFNIPGTQPALDSSTLNNWGYGLDFDDLERSQVQQFEDGIYNMIDTESVFYNSLDTEGGNSGSPILKTNTNQIVAIHTNGGCNTNGTGANSGTRIDNANLQNALANPQGICAGPFCGDFDAGSCYEANGSRGCSNQDCCATVCAVDPFCCNTNWDSICVGRAFDLCGNCGGADAGDCFVSNGSPGCELDSCCQAVCVDDPFCCNSTWDGICADSALILCAADVPPPCTADVEQNSNTVGMAGFGQADLAQSFIPTTNRVTGAGIFLREADPAETGNITIELWDNLPNAGGTLLASATNAGTEGQWVDVLFGQVEVTPFSTYYLVFTSDVSTISIAGDTNDPYAGGNVFANAGFNPFPTFDYTFRTCGENVNTNCEIDVNQPSQPTSMANFTQTDLAQSFVPNVNRIAGAGIFLRDNFTGTTDVTIGLWTNLPNAGGILLASGTATAGPNNWVDVEWAPVNVTAGQQYFLVFTNDGTSASIKGDTNNPYPNGQVYANAGFDPFPNFDYTFRTCGFQEGCNDDVRLDFGVTPDDLGDPNACGDGGPIVITTQYQQTQRIVFGTAVDMFSPPEVGILNDGACDPTCRSAGLPAFGPDWWCQFRMPSGTDAGVESFSAQLCFIDAPVGEMLMRGYDNSGNLIAMAANTTNDTEVLTIQAPAGTRIAYVQVGSPNRPSGVSVDCLAYPNPLPFIDTCPWDCADGDGLVGITDLLQLIGNWGGTGPCDIDGGGIGITDLLGLIANWGPCPVDTCADPFVCGAPEVPFCDPDETCVCVATFDGQFICIDAFTSCGVECPDGTCPEGFICVVDTCCGGDTTCIPESALCVEGLTSVPQEVKPGTMTITGRAGADQE